jgi:hypothetical protein
MEDQRQHAGIMPYEAEDLEAIRPMHAPWKKRL